MLAYVNRKEEEMIIPSNSRNQIVYRMKADSVGTRNLQIALSVDGEDLDILRRSVKVIEDGFDQ